MKTESCFSAETILREKRNIDAHTEGSTNEVTRLSSHSKEKPSTYKMFLSILRASISVVNNNKIKDNKEPTKDLIRMTNKTTRSGSEKNTKVEKFVRLLQN